MNHSRMGLVLGRGWGRAVPAGGWRLWGRRLAGGAGVLKVDYGKMGDITYSAAGIKFCLPFWLCLTNEVRSLRHVGRSMEKRDD